MLTPSKYLIVALCVIYTFNEVSAFGRTYWDLYCPRIGQMDISKCKFGYETSVCNKNRCLQGPDEECDDLSPMGKHCANNLRCSCGFCEGCYKGTTICSSRMCGGIKRTPSQPLWLTEMNRQQDEKRRLHELQLGEQQHQQLYLPSPREFMNVKSLFDRISNYPFNSSAEYNLQY